MVCLGVDGNVDAWVWFLGGWVVGRLDGWVGQRTGWAVRACGWDATRATGASNRNSLTKRYTKF